MRERPGREIPKDYREIVNYQIDRHGWRYDASSKGYPKLFPADKSQPPISIPKTPSSRHSIKGLVRKIRQRGGTWPPQGNSDDLHGPHRDTST